MHAMKDSGQEWLGAIPVDWEIDRIGTFFTQRAEKVSDEDYPPLSVTKQGVLPQLDHVAKSDDHANRKLVKKGDFAINSRSDRRNSCGFSPMDGSVSLINTVCEPHALMESRYFGYMFDTSQFADEYYAYGHGIVADLWTTGWKDMKKILVPVPPIDEQQRIADYLDDKCDEIDRAIAAAEASIEEYGDYFKSYAYLATTGKLDIAEGEVGSETGYGYLGLIPNSWDMRRLHFIFKVSSVKGKPDETVLSLYREYGVVPKDSRDDNYNVTSQDTSGYKYVEVGDFVINKMKAWQGSMALSDYQGIVSPAYHVFKFVAEDVEPKYMHHLLRSALYADEWRSLSTGLRVGQWDLHVDDFLNTWACIPPMKRQLEILNELDAKRSEVDEIITAKQSIIEDLKSYKQSLVYEVVTGKREV